MLLQTSFGFQDAINYLLDIGFYDIFLPFLLIFAIIFAILEKTKILGADKANINAIVAIVVDLLVVVQRGIVEIINLFLPRVSLIIVVILMGLLVIAMVAGKDFKGLKGTVLGVAIVIIIFAIILALTTPQTGSWSWLTPADKDTLIRIGVPLLIFILVIAMVTAKPKQPQKKSFLKELAKGFGGEEE